MKQVAIVGKAFRGFVSFMEKNHPELELIAFRDKGESNKYPRYVKRVFVLDFSSKEKITKDLLRLKGLDIIGLECQYENGVLAKSWIGEILGLPSISEEAALNATDKGLMRRCFQEKSPDITPAFAIVNSESEVIEFAEKYGFPLILKPANLAKSLLVTKNNNLPELIESFKTSQKSIERLYKKYGVHHRVPKLILEEFLEGRFFSIDLFVDSRGAITTFPPVDLVMAQALGINDNYNYSRSLPANVSMREEEELKNAAILGVKALGLTNSAAHCELVMTKKGPKIIEIGARFGGYRSKMYSLSYGINVYDTIYHLAIGAQINIDYSFKNYSAVYELFPVKKGKFAKIRNEDEVKKLASFISLKIPVKLGQEVGLSRDGFKFCANVTLANEDKNQFEKDCRYVEENMGVVLG